VLGAPNILGAPAAAIKAVTLLAQAAVVQGGPTETGAQGASLEVTPEAAVVALTTALPAAAQRRGRSMAGMEEGLAEAPEA
jgi:hypothetical protein